ncbi:hypothetical protein [Frankia sp. CiP3]|uniref:hypothetical protein n=1 Tax=Frankia sp. CiP3 TaxID=2880971 RepID=UPI001EF6964C|nr:hypothetical protein [Frankia sp. CiP3]
MFVLVLVTVSPWIPHGVVVPAVRGSGPVWARVGYGDAADGWDLRLARRRWTDNDPAVGLHGVVRSHL